MREATGLQGYLAHQKHLPPRTLQQDYPSGPRVVLGGGAVSYERGTPLGEPLVLDETCWTTKTGVSRPQENARILRTPPGP